MSGPNVTHDMHRSLPGQLDSLSLPRGPLVAPFWGLPYRVLNVSHKKELLRGLWVMVCFRSFGVDLGV